MLRNFVGPFALAFAWLVSSRAAAQASHSQASAPPPPAFQPVLYRAWQPGEPLPPTPRTPDAPTVNLIPGPEYRRRPHQVDFGLATLPFECLADRHACGSSLQFASLAWRGFPHFAWALAGARTDLRAGDRFYLGAGARVYAYERGVLDPFLELTLGGEVSTEAEGVALAGEVRFGLGIHLVEHLQLAPTLAFRHSEHRVGVCRSALAVCEPWSHQRTYWVALGLSVAAVWGRPQ